MDPPCDDVLLDNVLETPGTILFFKDRSGRFIRVSVDCARLTGRTPDQMVGLTDADLTDEAHARELTADEQSILATGLPVIDKQEIDRLANRPGTWVETSKFPLRSGDGSIIGTFGFSRDVTRWEAAERELEIRTVDLAAANATLAMREGQLRALLDCSLDAIIAYDIDLRYRYANPAAERFKDATRADLG